MKDDMDILLEKALQPNVAPCRDLNEKILRSMGDKRKNRAAFKLTRVAAVVIAILCVGSVGVYAANYILKKAIVTDHTLSVGNPDYIDDGAIASPEDAVTTENMGHEEGDETVNWITKDVQVVNGYATNTYYAYGDYETALLDSGLDNWFNTVYENDENVIYCVTETEDVMYYSIDAIFNYGRGTFSICESVITGNIAEDMAYSVSLQNTHNKRMYTSESGQEFTLVDEIIEDENGEHITTYVVIAYGDYYGSISFKNLTDDDIYQILDTVKIH